MWFVIYGKSFILSHVQLVYLVYLLLSSVTVKKMKEKGGKMNLRTKVTEIFLNVLYWLGDACFWPIIFAFRV